MPHSDFPIKGSTESIETLLEVMARLRHPTTGCPWDRKQDFHTIAPYTIEEAYEVADAISRGDTEALVDELGDLLFQVVFHAQMASEKAAFNFGDVVAAVVEKMIRRHPHVFGDERVDHVKAQSLSWEAHKARERKQRGSGNQEESLLDHVPEGLPAVKRAQKLQKRAATAGFDWPSAMEVIPKLEEEISELRQAMEEDAPAAWVAAELGDLIFSCINLARHLNIDAEMALRNSNTKFESRFKYIERTLARDGRSVAETDSDTLEALWDEAKRSTS
jgi:MazG family protein